MVVKLSRRLLWQLAGWLLPQHWCGALRAPTSMKRGGSSALTAFRPIWNCPPTLRGIRLQKLQRPKQVGKIFKQMFRLVLQ